MGNGDELQKNDMEIAADGNKLSVRFVSGMVEATGVEFALFALFSTNILVFHPLRTYL